MRGTRPKHEAPRYWARGLAARREALAKKREPSATGREPSAVGHETRLRKTRPACGS